MSTQVKRDTRKEVAMYIYNRILAGPTFERLRVDGPAVDLVPAELDRIMNYLFATYSRWMEDTLDAYVEFVPELRATELAERRKSARRKRLARE